MASAWRHKLTLCPWVLYHHAASAFLPFRCGLACLRSVALERFMASTGTTASTRSLDKWQHRAEGKAIYKES